MEDNETVRIDKAERKDCPYEKKMHHKLSSTKGYSLDPAPLDTDDEANHLSGDFLSCF